MNKKIELIVTVIAVIIIVGLVVRQNINNNSITRVEASDGKMIREIQKIRKNNSDKLDAWLDKLAAKENCGKGIVDVNGKWSRGPFCFQDATYRAFSKKYGVTDQKELARVMIENEKGGYKHWRCSVITDKKRCPSYTWGKGIGIPPHYE